MNSAADQQEANKNPLLFRLFGTKRPYFFKTPGWMKRMFPRRLWHIDTTEKIIYLSFDDGPHPVATPFVLDVLKRYDAKATFFCIGKNVVQYPGIYRRILAEGHVTGNHTQHHLNGWKNSTGDYLADISEAAQHVSSSLFRPPYGRITQRQASGLKKAMHCPAKIVMWDVLSGDFDSSLDADTCLSELKKNTGPGSIVVFHDSEKAFPLLSQTLPVLLEYFSGNGFSFKCISL